MSVLITVLLVAIAAYFFLRKKQRTPGAAQLNNYSTLLQGHVAFYQKLNDGEKKRFEKEIAEFLNDTRIEGVGTEITALDQVLIASGAVIPIFGFPGWRYQNLTNIILYPDTFDGEFSLRAATAISSAWSVRVT